MPKAGRAFWHETEDEGLHLWVILNTPDETTDAILVNFTDFEKYSNPLIEIERNYPWLKSGKRTTKRTTVHVNGAFTARLHKLVSILATQETVEELEPKLLERVRAAMYRGKCEQPVLDVLTKYLGKWCP